MIRLVLAGTDSRVLAAACAACPHAPAGCCTGPPRLDWSDIGRVVSRGGIDWLLGELDAGRVVPAWGGLALTERRGRARPGGPRLAKCVYHDVHGCTIAPERRPATCNYFVCDGALDAAGPTGRADAARARTLGANLAARFERWDAALAAEVSAAWPAGPAFDRAFLVWLGQRFDALDGESNAIAQARGIDENVEAHT
jgi:hypothetical protein